MHRRLCIYDFETNGWWNPRSPTPNQPIQVAIKIVELDGTEHNHATYIKCPTRLSYDIQYLTGITDQKLAEKGMDIEKVFARINELVNVPETLIVGHNILRFDNGFMNHYLKKYGYEPLNVNYCFDTAGHFKGHLFREVRSEAEFFGEYHGRLLNQNYKNVTYTLEEACHYYGVPTNAKFHNAISDIEYTYGVFKEQVKDYDNKKPINPDRLSNKLKLALNNAYKSRRNKFKRYNGG